MGGMCDDPIPGDSRSLGASSMDTMMPPVRAGLMGLQPVRCNDILRSPRPLIFDGRGLAAYRLGRELNRSAGTLS